MALVKLALLATLTLAIAVAASSSEGGPNAACASTTLVGLGPGDYGCAGVATRQVQTRWQFANNTAYVVDWSINGYGDSMIIFYSGTDYIDHGIPNARGQNYFFEKNKIMQVVYNGGQNVQSQYGPTFKVSIAPAMHTLVSGQTFSIQQLQAGGFVYFLLPRQEEGLYLQMDVEVDRYQGLRPPSVFMSGWKVPTLEQYDYTNVTVSSAGHETCLIAVKDPKAGAYVVGVFMYGTAASMAVKATWQFKTEYLVSGVKVSMQLGAGGVKLYQIYAPIGTSKLTFQLSRELPGGYPIAYIAQGVVPSPKQYEYVADTKKQSYFSISINQPNPAKSTAANPGYWMIAIYAQDNVNAGFILQADITK